MEAQWKSRKRLRHGDADATPLYTQKDAMAAFPLFSAVTYGEAFSPAPGITVTFRDAGHILGAAMVELAVLENDRGGRLPIHGIDLREPEP